MKTVTQTLENLIGTAGVRAWDTLEPAQQVMLLRAVVPGTQPQYWVAPNTQEELAAVMAIAHQNRWRVLPCGHGSKLHWGGLADGITLVVSTERLNRLIDHAVGDLTVTAEAGMPLAQLQEILGRAGQFLAINPSDPNQATLGGIIATGDTGSLRHRYNSVRDMLLGISFARADGQLVKAGGRVVKNVAGYDLMKLLTGSYGTLGIITQVTFRVYPMPQTSQTVVLSGDAEAIAQATQTLLSSALEPTSINLLSPQAMKNLHLGQNLGLMVRFHSIPESVVQQGTRLVEVGTALGLSAASYPTAEEATLWQRSTELISEATQEDTIVCKIGVKPSQAVEFLNGLEVFMPTARIVIHMGSGLGQLRVEGVRSTQIQEVRSRCQSTGGYLSILEAPIHFKQQIDVWGYSGNALALMKRIKHQFDPENVLSPHRFIGGI